MMHFIAATQTAGLYEKKEFIHNGDTLRYRIMYPENYSAARKYPLVLFLHGSGERGSDNEAQLVHGARLFSDSANRKKYPAIVIFPQCPRNDFWSRISRDPNKKDSLNGVSFPVDQPAGKALSLTMQLLDQFVNEKIADKKRIYVGGLSMGGMGVFEILWRKPKFFAAAIPICGGGNPEKSKVYGKKLPVWIFHGDNDQSVRVSHSRLMFQELKKVKAKVRYTEYPGVGHNSWENAFAEPGLLPWLFAQKK